MQDVASLVLLRLLANLTTALSLGQLHFNQILLRFETDKSVAFSDDEPDLVPITAFAFASFASGGNLCSIYYFPWTFLAVRRGVWTGAYRGGEAARRNHLRHF